MGLDFKHTQIVFLIFIAARSTLADSSHISPEQDLKATNLLKYPGSVMAKAYKAANK